MGGLLTSSEQWEENKNLLAEAVMIMMSSFDSKKVAVDATPSESDQSSEPEREPCNTMHAGEIFILQPAPTDIPLTVLAADVPHTVLVAAACDQPGLHENESQKVSNSPERSMLDERARREKKKEMRRKRRKASSLITLAWEAQQQEQQAKASQQTWQQVDQQTTHAHAESIAAKPMQCKDSFCTRCHNEIERHFKFCRFCGAASPSCESHHTF
jgi:hypothetical protein